MTRFSQSHFQACLLGGAIGDALGNPVEFLDIQSIRQRYGEQGLDQLVDPEFTDDTQMTLFTTEALIRFSLQTDRRDLQLLTELHQAYLRWLHTQDQDEAIPASLRTGWLLKQPSLFQQKAPGKTCLSALRGGKMGSRAQAINLSKGCGGVMRVAPIGLYFWRDPEKAFRLGADSAAITHGHPSGFLSAGTLAAQIALLVEGQSLNAAVMNALDILRGYPKHEEVLFHLDRALEMQAGGLKATPENLARMGASWPGAVGEEALAMSVFCALSFPEDYRSSVLAAINHSGDSDSTGTITGQISALLNGPEALPSEWVLRLQMHEQIQQLASDLWVLTEADRPPSPELLSRHRPL